MCVGHSLVLVQLLAVVADPVDRPTTSWREPDIFCEGDSLSTCRRIPDQDSVHSRVFGRPWKTRRDVILIQRNKTHLHRAPNTAHPHGGVLNVDHNTSLVVLHNSSRREASRWRKEAKWSKDAKWSKEAKIAKMNMVRESMVWGNPDPGNPEFAFSPVSTTMYCVIYLTIVLLLCYTILAVLRNQVELSQEPQAILIAQGLQVAVRSSHQGAALGTLFVGMRMYVLAQTNGQGNPEAWVKSCMIGACVGVTLQIVVALMLPYLMDEPKEGEKSVAERAGQETDAHPRLNRKDFTSGFGTAFILQVIAILLIYGGAVGVIAGIFFYDPKEDSGSDFLQLSLLGVARRVAQKAQVSPAVTGVIILDAMFFFNQLHLFISREMGKAMGGVIVASLRARKAPMLAVMFLAARMRNLQFDPSGVAPAYVNISYFVICAALFCEMAVSALGGPPRKPRKEADGEEVDRKIKESYHPTKTHPCVHLCQQVFAGILFAALIVVIHFILIAGGDVPLSTAMKCIMALGLLFFSVHVFQWCATFSTRQDKWGDILKDTALSAGVAVSLCPMLSILIVGCRVRALQLTNQKGAPQWWCQDAMCLIVFAIFTQVTCCMLLPAFTGMATSVDGDGNAKYDLKPMIGAYFVQIIKYVALLALYLGVAIVVFAMFQMYEGMKDQSHPADAYKAYLIDAGVLLVIFVVAALLSSAKVFGLFVKWTIEAVDETFLGVQITVGKAALSIFRGYVFLQDLVVENPEGKGFVSPCLLKIGKVVVKVNLWRIITSAAGTIEVNTLVLTGVQVNYEKDMWKKSNLQCLLDFLDPPGQEEPIKATAPPIKATEPSPLKPKEEEKKEESTTQAPAFQFDDDFTPPEIILHLLQIGDIGANAWNSHAGRVLSIVLGSIESNDFQEHFGGKTSVLVGDVISMVLKTILNTVLANAKNLVMEVANLGKFVGKEAGCGNCLAGIGKKKGSAPSVKRLPDKPPAIADDDDDEDDEED